MPGNLCTYAAVVSPQSPQITAPLGSKGLRVSRPQAHFGLRQVLATGQIMTTLTQHSTAGRREVRVFKHIRKRARGSHMGGRCGERASLPGHIRSITVSLLEHLPCCKSMCLRVGHSARLHLTVTVSVVKHHALKCLSLLSEFARNSTCYTPKHLHVAVARRAGDNEQ